MQQYSYEWKKMNINSELNALVVNRLLDHFSSFQFKENMGSIAIGQRLKLSCIFFCQPFLQMKFLVSEKPAMLTKLILDTLS